MDVSSLQGHAIHLAGSLRQLVGLVDDDGTTVRQDWPATRAAVDGVRQQEVVVADLEVKIVGITRLHEAEVSTAGLLAVAMGGDADTFLIVAAQMFC